MSVDYRQILKQYWGYDDFQGIQREIIESIGQGRDTLGLMPTGGGKSITFQVPAIASDGLCLVVTPLISLMNDQVNCLRKMNIIASAIHSGMVYNDILTTLDNCILGQTKLLYISPERISSELFIGKLKQMKVSFVAVDEAHCISQWGYDFRQAYLNIADIRKVKPNIPILALTATATPDVVEDIQRQLQFRERNVFRMSFERQNLVYVVRNTEDKTAEIIHILKVVEGSAIVYVRVREQTKLIADALNTHGISAVHYHAGLEYSLRNRRQTAWSNGDVRVMVATNAFGMGIDKADVRTVIHADPPNSVEEYFQEAGRAGRDGKKAFAVLLYNGHDTTKLKKRIDVAFPEKSYIENVYEHLAYFFQVGLNSGKGYSFVFDLARFCNTYHFFPTTVTAALRILDSAGYINYIEDADSNMRVKFLLRRDDLYKIHETSPNEEKVIEALLRSYTGLFADYVNIEESTIAYKTGLSNQQVYVLLTGLSHQRIIHFIPRRNEQMIEYVLPRVDIKRMVIPKTCYEDRKRQLSKRIKAMIAYAVDKHECRSRQLLRYFGEKKNNNCGQCDVCLNHKTLSKKKVNEAKQNIRQMFNDGKEHMIYDLKGLNLPKRYLEVALEELVEDEELLLNGSEIKLKLR